MFSSILNPLSSQGQLQWLMVFWPQHPSFTETSGAFFVHSVITLICEVFVDLTQISVVPVGSHSTSFSCVFL